MKSYYEILLRFIEKKQKSSLVASVRVLMKKWGRKVPVLFVYFFCHCFLLCLLKMSKLAVVVIA